MPHGSRRPARAKQLIRKYKAAKEAHKRQLYRRRTRLRQAFRLANAHQHHKEGDTEMLSDLSSLSEDSDNGQNSNNSDSEESQASWDDLLGPNWQSQELGSLFSSTSIDNLSSDEDEAMPALLPIGTDSDTESEISDDVAGSDGNLVDNVMDFEADDELDNELSDDEGNEEPLHPSHVRLGKWARLRRWVLEKIRSMYKNRYETSRDGLPRGPSYLHHILMCLKTERPDHFRSALRINPDTFDALVEAIENDPVFQNNSQHPQMPVEQQLAITLYRFGHDGNASGLQAVANWAGVGKGTVSVVTRRVMTAILRPSFMKNAVCYPTEEEKEEAKRYVEQHSCHAWRNGWCFVDGTLVPLASRPAWYGESYFDRKSRYSLNFQVN